MPTLLTKCLGAAALSMGGLLFTAGPAPAAQADTVATSSWPMALHSAYHDGVAPVLGPQTGHVAWTRDLGAAVTPGPVVGSDGTIYVATNAGVLHAINPATGADVWTLNAPTVSPDAAAGNDLSVSPLVLSSGAIVWPAPGGHLEVVSPSGTVEWSQAFKGSLTSPAVAAGGLYVGTTAGEVIKLTVTGGLTLSVAWTKSIGHSSFGSVVVAPDGQIVTTVDNCVVDLVDHGTSGSIRWFHAFRGSVEVSAAVSRTGTIVVGANTGFEYGFSPSGQQRWKVSLNRAFSYSSPAVSSAGIAYFGDNNGVLHAVWARSGRPVTSYHGGHALWAAQAIDRSGDVYFGTQGHTVEGYTASGHQLFDVAVSGAVDSYPALTGTGQLVVGDQKGILYAIG